MMNVVHACTDATFSMHIDHLQWLLNLHSAGGSTTPTPGSVPAGSGASPAQQQGSTPGEVVPVALEIGATSLPVSRSQSLNKLEAGALSLQVSRSVTKEQVRQ
jgi:hypothetical protein